jgi:predicted RNA-binding Zn-ribbon protein involved in translation (DUF1610 family)
VTTNPYETSYGYEKGRFNETCPHCGAVYEVIVPGQKGHEESEEYYCPECMYMNKTRASNSPQVTLILSRTDGKTDKCAYPGT